MSSVEPPSASIEPRAGRAVAFPALLAATCAAAAIEALRASRISVSIAAMATAIVGVLADRVLRRGGASASRVWTLRLCAFGAAWIAFDLGPLPPSVPLFVLPLAFGIDRPVRVRRWAGPMLGLATLAGVCVLADLWVIVRRPDVRDTGDYPASAIVPDPALGYRCRPGAHRARRMLDDEVVYDVVYTVDAAGHRVVPRVATSSESDGAGPDGSPAAAATAASHTLALLGCSYTFGEGVADDATMGAHLARVLPATRIVPFALSGWGPQQAMTYVTSEPLRAELRGAHADGVLFLLLPDHHLRLDGSYTSMRWVAATPRWTYDGPIACDGTFESVQPARTELLRRLRAWPAIDRLLVNVDAATAGSRDRAGFARFVAAISDEFARATDGGRLLVCIWPRAGGAAEPYVRALTDAHVRVLDLTPLAATMAADADPSRFTIRWDGHPTGAYYEMCAAAVAAEVRRMRDAR